MVGKRANVSTAPRAYHHGNLAHALTAAATAMAADGGPDAVVLREAARRVGVSPTAAYRHFAGQQALLDAVKDAAVQRLADHLRAAMDAVHPVAPGDGGPDERTAAIERLAAIGRAYFDFAIDQPGLFRCFCIGLPMPARADDIEDDAAFGVLTQALDALVTAGAMPAARRAGADIAAWSAVHGLAVLCLDGPMAEMPRAEQQELLSATVHMVLRGLVDR